MVVGAYRGLRREGRGGQGVVVVVVVDSLGWSWGAGFRGETKTLLPPFARPPPSSRSTSTTPRHATPGQR